METVSQRQTRLLSPSCTPTLEITSKSQSLPDGGYCLFVALFPSREVLQVSLLYLRVISACGDGKIRIYNFLNGNCLKVIKVDARGDPVLSFFYQGNRWVVGRCGGWNHEQFCVICFFLLWDSGFTGRAQ